MARMMSYLIAIAAGLALPLAAHGEAFSPATVSQIAKFCEGDVAPVPVIYDDGSYTGELIIPIFDENGAAQMAIPVNHDELQSISACADVNLDWLPFIGTVFAENTPEARGVNMRDLTSTIAQGAQQF